MNALDSVVTTGKGTTAPSAEIFRLILERLGFGCNLMHKEIKGVRIRETVFYSEIP